MYFSCTFRHCPSEQREQKALHVELLRRGGPCGLLTQQPGRIELGEARREPVRADRRAGGLELLDELRHAREGTAAASRL